MRCQRTADTWPVPGGAVAPGVGGLERWAAAGTRMETAGCRGESQEERPCASLHPSSLLSAGLHSHGSTPASPPQGPVRTGLQLHALSPPVRGPAPGWAESPNPDVCVALAAGGVRDAHSSHHTFQEILAAVGAPSAQAQGSPKSTQSGQELLLRNSLTPAAHARGWGATGLLPGQSPTR